MKPQTKFILVAAFALLLILVLECINKRFWLNDFKVYYSAASAFVHQQPVYNVPFGEDTGLYKYAPALLFVFAPYTVLPYQAAAVLHYLLIVFATISLILLCFRLCSRFAGNDLKRPFLFLFIALLVVMNHLFRELHLGNVNVILVWVLVMSLNHMLEGKQILAGFLLAFACLFKPYFLLLLVPLFLFRKIKTALWSVVFVAAIVVVTSLFSGIANSILMYKAWWGSMQDHSVFLESWQTVNFLFSHYFGLNLISANILPAIVLLVWGYLVFAMGGHKFPSAENNDGFLVFTFFCLLAFIPNLVITDTEHFLFSLPLIIYSMRLLPQLNNKVLPSLFIVAMFLYGANSPEWFGSELADDLEHHGMLGIGNLLLISLATIIFYKTIRLKTSAATL